MFCLSGPKVFGKLFPITFYVVIIHLNYFTFKLYSLKALEKMKVHFAGLFLVWCVKHLFVFYVSVGKSSWPPYLDIAHHSISIEKMFKSCLFKNFQTDGTKTV